MGRVNGGLNLSRSFGDFDYKQNYSLQYDEQMITCKPEIREVKKSEEDEFILMGCDGIWEKFVDNSKELLEHINKDLTLGKPHQRIIEDLLDFLLAKSPK